MRNQDWEEHTQVSVVYNGETVEVDEGMVELLSLMWARGITTMWSCQGDVKFRDQTCWSNDKNRGYVMMLRTKESLRFIQDLILLYPPMQIGRKVLFDIEFDHHNSLHGRVIIRFPNSDIPKLVKFLNLCG